MIFAYIHKIYSVVDTSAASLLCSLSLVLFFFFPLLLPAGEREIYQLGMMGMVGGGGGE